MQFTVKCYSVHRKQGEHCFYVLNKGLNSGKPLFTPCANCFEVSCADALQYDFFYWLCFGLWQCKGFHYYLKGSVIEFITIGDLKKFVQAAADIAKTDEKNFTECVAQLNKLREIENNLRKQMQLAGIVKTQLFKKYVTAPRI